MKHEFTSKYIKENKGCYKLIQVNKLSFIKKKVITIADIINSEMPYNDKIWWLWNKCEWSFDERYTFIKSNSKIMNILSGHGLVFAILITTAAIVLARFRLLKKKKKSFYLKY